MDFGFAFRRYRVPFRAPIRTPGGWWREREGLYVRIVDAGGRARYGEASPIPTPGAESVGDGERLCRALGDRIGAEALARIPKHLASLRNALACAFPGETPAAAHSSLRVAALLPAGRGCLKEASACARAGFRSFKWKVGVEGAGDEMAMLEDLLAALPASATLRLDANGAWDQRTAERWLARCSERPIEFVEQPVAAYAKGAEDLLRGLAADHPVPLALDESIRGDADLGRWLDSGWPGYFVVKPALLGDLPQALERLSRARARVVFSSSLETAIGAQAALRAAMGWPGDQAALGFGVWPLFAQPLFDGPAAVPILTTDSIKRIDPAALWNALT